jgi:branched-chain amino acid transport system ATP-binding protein
LLRVEDLTTKYKDATAVSGVSFDVKDGEIVSVVGSNGAGKTTIINTISGIIRCSGGRVFFGNDELTFLPAHKIVQRGVVQIPEGRILFPRMSVLENLEMGCYGNFVKKDMPRRLENVFLLFPRLKERQSQFAGTLSGGEQQMLAIARGLMANPKLLMLDEPSLGLAPIIVEHIFETIEEINKGGTSILLVEQNIFHSLEISNRGFVLENGRIVLFGNAGDLLENDQVRSAYIGV